MNAKKILIVVISVFMIKAGYGQGNSLDLHMVKLHSGKVSAIPGFTGAYGGSIGTSGKMEWRLSGSIGFGGKSTIDGLQCYTNYPQDAVSTFSVTYKYIYYIASGELQGFISGNSEDGGLYARAGLGFRNINSRIRYNDYPDGYYDTLYLGGSPSFTEFSSTDDEISGLCANVTAGYEFPALDFANLYLELGTSFGLGKDEFETLNPTVISLRFGIRWLIGQ